MNTLLNGGRTLRGVIQGDSVPQLLIPKLVELYQAGRFPFDRLVRYYEFEDINRAFDDTRSGVVLTCIHHRDQARVYLKQVHGGEGELELSPEEAEAVRLALSPAGNGAGLMRFSPGWHGSSRASRILTTSAIPWPGASYEREGTPGVATRVRPCPTGIPGDGPARRRAKCRDDHQRQ